MQPSAACRLGGQLLEPLHTGKGGGEHRRSHFSGGIGASQASSESWGLRAASGKPEGENGFSCALVPALLSVAVILKTSCGDRLEVWELESSCQVPLGLSGINTAQF